MIELTTEEAEALRLRNIKDLEQIDCAKQMKTSQSTFQRILSSAYKKITEAEKEELPFAVKRLRPWFRYGNAGILPQLWWHLPKYDVIHLNYPFLFL